MIDRGYSNSSYDSTTAISHSDDSFEMDYYSREQGVIAHPRSRRRQYWKDDGRGARPGKGYRQSRDMNQFFNNVLSHLASVGVVLMLYLNYLMFESYLGEFLSAFIFCEALWDTKQAAKNWLEKINYIATKEKTSMSLRSEVLSWFQVGLDGFSPTQFNPLNQDSSVIYIKFGLLMTALVTKPEVFFAVALFFFCLFAIAVVFDNRLLFLFRIHHYIGITNDTLAATWTILGCLLFGVVLSGSFVVMMYRDLGNLNAELSNFVEKQFKEDGWANEVLRENIPKLRSAIEEYVNNMETELGDDKTWQKLASISLNIFDSFNNTVSETSDTVPADICFGEFEFSFEKMKEQLECIAKDSFEIFGPQLFQPLTEIFSHTTPLLAVTTSLSALLLDVGLRLAFFVTLLFLLLSSKETVVQSIFASITAGANADHSNQGSHLVLVFEQELRRSMEAVLLLPVKQSLLNSFATMLVFWLFDVQGKFLCASMVLFFTLFPLITPYWLILPWMVLYVSVYGWSYTWVIFIFIVHYCCHYLAATWVLNGMNARTNAKKKKKKQRKQKQKSWPSRFDLWIEPDSADDEAASLPSAETENSTTGTSDGTPEAKKEDEEGDSPAGKREYVTSLSMFFGLVTFGPKGIVTGPFLFCLITISHKVYISYRRIIEEDAKKPSELVESSSPEPFSPMRRASELIRRTHSGSEIERSLAPLLMRFTTAKSDDNIFVPNEGLKSVKFSFPNAAPRTRSPSSPRADLKRSQSAGALRTLHANSDNNIKSLAKGMKSFFTPKQQSQTAEPVKPHSSQAQALGEKGLDPIEPEAKREGEELESQKKSPRRSRFSLRSGMKEVLPSKLKMLRELEKDDLISEEEFSKLRLKAFERYL